MLQDKDRIFTNLSGNMKVDINSSISRGDWIGIEKILSMPASAVIEIIKESGLRGRGGAGFSTGTKWSFIEKNKSNNRPSYLIINADESEPGACKDRDIIRYEPHKLLEGAVISAYAIQARTIYIYIRGEYYEEYKILKNALREAQENYLILLDGEFEQYEPTQEEIVKMQEKVKLPYAVRIILHRGAGAYICGEESALLNSLEGKRGVPRLKPPNFPAVCGLYGCPTVVNNVETISVISSIMKRGSDWFKGIGNKNNSGTKVFSISGHVNTPCNIEEKMSIPLKDLIEKYANGVIGGWENLLGVIPGGISMPIIPSSICETILMDFDSLSEVGSGLGSGSIIVINKSTDIVKLMTGIAYFYMDESCGQCTPCREGTGWIYKILSRISNGGGRREDIYLLKEIATQIEGHTICALGEAAAWPIKGFLKNFESEIIERIEMNKV